MKVVVITNIPSPYRVLQFDKISEKLDGNFTVIYYRKNEPNRSWDIPKIKHHAFFLKQTIFSRINFYPDIFKYLLKENPEVIIAAGFTLTIIVSFIYSRIRKVKFIVFTDSWIHSVNNLKFFQKQVRRFIIPRADASICVGKKGKEFLLQYGAEVNSIFISPLAIDNTYYQGFYKSVEDREFDIMFSGQFIDRKLPFFVIDVLKGLKAKNINFRFQLIGSGPLESEIIKRLEENQIFYFYPGFIQQDALPKYYSNSKILLFPSKDDPWGLVANEACAVGTPVITCENTGVAADLIIHNFNGYILPLDVNLWVDHCCELLQNNKLHETFSKNAITHGLHYTPEVAANHFISAFKSETIKLHLF